MAKKKPQAEVSTSVDNVRKTGEVSKNDTLIRGKDQTGRKKPTKAQRVKAKIMARAMLLSGSNEWDMRKAITDAFGCGGGVSGKIIKAARDDMIAEYKDESGALAAESQTLYRQWSQDEENEMRDRINARKRLDELRGHDAPKKQYIEVEAQTDVGQLLTTLAQRFPDVGHAVPKGTDGNEVIRLPHAPPQQLPNKNEGGDT